MARKATKLGPIRQMLDELESVEQEPVMPPTPEGNTEGGPTEPWEAMPEPIVAPEPAATPRAVPSPEKVVSTLYRIKYVGPPVVVNNKEYPHKIGTQTCNPYAFFTKESAISYVKNSPNHFEWADDRPMDEDRA